MLSRFKKVILRPATYFTFIVLTPLNAVVFGAAAEPMATPLANVMSSSAGTVTPMLAAALMLPETALIESAAEVVGVPSGATVTSTLTVTGLASVMLTVAGVKTAL